MTTKTRDRHRLTAALLGPAPEPAPQNPPVHVYRGALIESSQHLLSLATPEGEKRFVCSGETAFWRGAEVLFSELRPGQDVLVRCAPGSGWIAERVWADLARVTGVITAADGDTLEVDTGHDREPAAVVIPYRASGRMRVRHPRLEPGYLFDAIGIHDDGAVRALIPATSQPPYPVAEAPRRPPVRQGAMRVSGMVSWYDPALGRDTRESPLGTLTGLAYPALDRAADCGPACDRTVACAPLPLLSLGATVHLVNECAGRGTALPLVACGAAASHFCDRCTACASQERGRIAQLTLASFAALGGNPEVGCFNAVLAAG